MRSDSGSAIRGMLAIGLLLAATAAVYWGALWLNVRGVFIALTAVGFFGGGLLVPAAIAVVIALLRSDEPRDVPRFWPYFIWLCPLAISGAGTWGFWSAPRSTGAVAVCALVGSLCVVLAGWGVLIYLRDPGPRVPGASGIK